MSDIPYGYCHCGCGKKTKTAMENNPKHGWVKGQPFPYVKGHRQVPHPDPSTINLSGFCMCGCGKKTNVPKRTYQKRGWFKGVPQKFYPGHFTVRSNKFGRCDLPIEEHFWSKVKKGSPDECWEWTGSRRKHERWGYYGIFYHRCKTLVAHRVAYKLTYGDIPDGMLVCHKCDNPPCCNPSHLFLGTNADNMQDMASKGRTGVKHGSEHPSSKLTESQIPEIRRLIDAGIPKKKIGAMYGVSEYPILCIAHGKLWKHVP